MDKLLKNIAEKIASLLFFVTAIIFLTVAIINYDWNGDRSLLLTSAISSTINAPSSLNATAASGTQVQLAWQDNSTNESGFVIERQTSSSTFSKIASVGKNVVSYIDQNLNPGATYYYRVRAFKSGSYSSYSNIASATTPSPSASSCPNYAGGMLPRNLWTWQYNVATDATARSNFFSFADAHAIQTIYLESEYLIRNNQSALANFINEANTHCMGVELLYSYNQWVYAANQAYPVDLAQRSVSFANGLTGTKPLGVHYDVEPYTLPEWDSTSTSGGILNQYLDLLEKLASTTRGTPLKLNVDVPFWYDTCAKCTITRNGQTLNMSNAVIDRVDKITIMDYSDNTNNIISRAAGEISYANPIGKKVTIGVEAATSTEAITNNNSAITFYEEGAAVMDQALVSVNNNYSTSPSYAGVAVHDYRWYNILKP